MKQIPAEKDVNIKAASVFCHLDLAVGNKLRPLVGELHLQELKDNNTDKIISDCTYLKMVSNCSQLLS